MTIKTSISSFKNTPKEIAHIKISELIKKFPDTMGAFRKRNKEGTLLEPFTKVEHSNISNDYITSIDFDLPIYIEDSKQILSFVADDGEKYILSENIKGIEFVNCIFRKDFHLSVNLDILSFDKCIFDAKCYINNQYKYPKKEISIKEISIKDTKFLQNFKLHNTKLEKFTLKDTDFEKNADFFKTEFSTQNNIVFHAINFRGLSLFGNTIFNEHLIFEYVTFQGYSHFRQATFNKGLNLEYSNIEKEMNFFGIEGLDKKESIEKTTQETYRIVKYQLQKVGSIIDSNIYHSLELGKREKVCELSCKNWRFLADCLVLNIHKISSNYSTNWFWALLWILFFGVLTNAVIFESYFEPNTWLNTEFYKYSYALTPLSEFCGKTWLFILNKVVLGYLYYQFVTAIRKDTRK